MPRSSPPTRRAVLTTTAAGVLLGGCGMGGWDEFTDAQLTIATGNVGGVFHRYGEALATVLRRRLDGVTVSTRRTNASVVNVREVSDRVSDIGFALADVAADARRGRGRSEDPAERSCPGGGSSVTTRTSSGWSCRTRSGTTARGSTRHRAPGSPRRCRSSRSAPPRASSPRSSPRPGWARSSLRSPPPRPSPSTRPRSSCSRRSSRGVNEVYEESTIPGDTYDLSEDIPTIAVPNVLVVREDMPENVACALTTLLVDERGALTKVHPAAKEIDAETMDETGPIPMHPGSERALEDQE